MSQYLPTSNFKWNLDNWGDYDESKEYIKTDKIMSLGDKDSKGYLFEVDTHIPIELHDHMNQYPPLAENMSIKKEYLNEWQQKDYKQSNIKKLCLSFHDKKNYVINYRLLKLFISLGVKITKINRVLEYTQSDFLKKYIDLNTNMRKKAGKNEFHKDFFKLMNNSVFGKTMENVRNRINFRLISSEEEALRVKNMKRFTIFDNNLVGVHINKTSVSLNKPVYLGQNILDESKLLMSNFHYNFMLKQIKRENIDLLFTDTDSLCYEVRKVDPFEIIKQNKNWFDLSDYPENHELYDPTNKKVIGKFKNESIEQITQFVGLRSKLYSFTVDNEYEDGLKKHNEKYNKIILDEQYMTNELKKLFNDEKNNYIPKYRHNRCKGTKKSVVESSLNIDDYKNTLETNESKNMNQNVIRSYSHTLYTETINKVALSSKDDKVFINENFEDCLNFGHYKCKK
jgi:hypothetical protein